MNISIGFDVDVQITAFTNFTPSNKSNEKNNSIFNHRQFTDLNQDESRPSQNTYQLSKNSLRSNAIIKTPPSNNLNFILSKSKTNLNLSQATATSTIQVPSVEKRKGVLLYQQVELNRLLPNGVELMNRFNLEV